MTGGGGGGAAARHVEEEGGGGPTVPPEQRAGPLPLVGSPFTVQVERNANDLVTTIGGSAPQDYMLERSVFDDAARRWGTCTVDAFASEATALLPRFWTLTPTPGAEGTDATQQDKCWASADERIWAHPPAVQLEQLVALLRRAERRAEVIVCVPMWSNRDWYHALIDLADDKMKVQAGKLQRIAEDAPKRLEEWPVVIFRVPTRAAKAPVTPLLLPPSTA